MSVRWWHVLVFVVALVLAAAARAPASVFIPSRDGAFSYARAGGTIWNARFERARLGGYDAGLVTWRLSLGDLVNGKLKADVSASGGALAGQATLLANWRGDRRIIAPSLRLQGAPIAPNITLAGDTTVNGLDLYFASGVCSTAAGTLASDVLARNAELLRWRGPQLAGGAACEGEAARLALAGAEGAEAVQASFLLRASGAGAWRADVRSARPETQAALAAAGFAPSPQEGPALMIKEDAWGPL